MMKKDLTQRYSIEDVMKHPYWGVDWDWDKMIGKKKSKIN